MPVSLTLFMLPEIVKNLRAERYILSKARIKQKAIDSFVCRPA
jgi:hypothetical protein